LIKSYKIEFLYKEDSAKPPPLLTTREAFAGSIDRASAEEDPFRRLSEEIRRFSTQDQIVLMA
jgi:hypothetical protein